MDTIKPEHENAAKAISPVCMLETNKGTVAFVTGWPPIKREKTSVPVYCLPPGEPHIIPQAQDAQETCGYAKGTTSQKTYLQPKWLVINPPRTGPEERPE